MGQRSQIYISVNNNEGNKVLIARYFSWNFGSRMVSRARGLMEWLKNYMPYLYNMVDRIPKVAEVNFDMRDVIDSSNLVKESLTDGGMTREDRREYIFNQPNNDGKLFIEVKKDGTIAYAFTGFENEYPMSASEYMAWNNYEDEEEDGSNCAENIKYITANFELMHTTEELEDFISADYVNLV